MFSKSFNPIETSDGSVMDIWVTVPREAKKGPALILLNEGFGVDQHTRSVAERLCNEGYAVFAPDLFHRKQRQVQLPYTDIPAAMPFIDSVTIENLLTDLTATLSMIQALSTVNRDKIGTLGFCHGGRFAYIANSKFRIAAGVSFYGVGIDNMITMGYEPQSPHVFFWGARDIDVPVEQTDFIKDSLIAAGSDVTSVTISYAGHAFFQDERSSYQPLAARQAWGHTLSFFDYLLK